jgi:hypothetical protein
MNARADDGVPSAINDVANAARELGRCVSALRDVLGGVSRAAYQRGGVPSSTDVAQYVGVVAINREIAALFAGVGLGPVLEHSTAAPITADEYIKRWNRRVANKQLLGRDRPSSTMPGGVPNLPGVKFHDPDADRAANENRKLFRGEPK